MTTASPPAVAIIGAGVIGWSWARKPVITGGARTSSIPELIEGYGAAAAL
jgi:hypothetical protein